jgi:hypothetical protein
MHAPPSRSPEPLTLAEAATRIGITRQSVAYLIDNQILPATRRTIPGQPRGMWYISAADVDDYARRPTKRHRGPRTTRQDATT